MQVGKTGIIVPRSRRQEPETGATVRADQEEAEGQAMQIDELPNTAGGGAGPDANKGDKHNRESAIESGQKRQAEGGKKRTRVRGKKKREQAKSQDTSMPRRG